MGFGSKLGELAGQDIVLWRDAGLDPHDVSWSSRGTRSSWVEGLVRRLAYLWRSGPLMPTEPTAPAPSPIHVIARLDCRAPRHQG